MGFKILQIMKTIKYLITLTLVAFLSLGCNKTINKGKEYTVEGRLMYNCETPMDNTEFSFRQGDPGILGIKTPLSLLVKTDAEGYFKVVYNGKEANVSNFTIRDGGTIMDNIPVFENINLGNVFWQLPPVSFIRRLNVINQLTQYDTLLLTDYNDPNPLAELRISGPFENGIIDTVWNISNLKSFTYNSPIIFESKYRLTSSSVLTWESATFSITEFCSEQLYDAVIKIE